MTIIRSWNNAAMKAPLLALLPFAEAIASTPVSAATNEEIERDFMRAALVPVAGYLVQSALKTIKPVGPSRPDYKSVPDRRVRELLIGAYRSELTINRRPEDKFSVPFLPREGIVARAEPRRWRNEIIVFVDAELGIKSSLRDTVDALSHATKLKFRVETLGPSNSMAGIIIEGFGHARIEPGLTNRVTYDPRLNPVVSTRRQPPNADRQYCFFRAFQIETILRCVTFNQLTKNYRARFGAVRSFWPDAVIFTPNEWAHVDGFLSADRSQEIYFAQCFIPIGQPMEVRDQLGLECLIRALGLPASTHFAGPSALETRILLFDPLERKEGRAPYKLGVSKQSSQDRTSPPSPAPTEYDLELLEKLYQQNHR